jgi:pimeloyl-ACP methyl ester carboxylesterase
MLAAATNTVDAQGTAPKPAKSGHVQANGVDYYYEIHGSGEPLLLLHGGLGSSDMFDGNVLPALAKTRQVIAVDLQGHGRTTLGDRPIDLVDIGNDLAFVLDKLGFKQVDVAGYSFGGGAGLRLAIQHPAVVRRLVVISAPIAQNGFFPEMLPQQAAVGAAMAEQMKETPMYKSYVAVAPNPKDFPRLLDRMGEYMRRPYDWSEDVKKLAIPVMLVYGDADMVRPDHIVKFYQLVGGGLKDAGWQREHMSRARLAIIPDVTHYEMFLSPVLAPTILPFLDGKSGSKSWADQVKK